MYIICNAVDSCALLCACASAACVMCVHRCTNRMWRLLLSFILNYMVIRWNCKVASIGLVWIFTSFKRNIVPMLNTFFLLFARSFYQFVQHSQSYSDYYYYCPPCETRTHKINSSKTLRLLLIQILYWSINSKTNEAAVFRKQILSVRHKSYPR